MKKLFTLVVLTCLLGTNRVWASREFYFFSLDGTNIVHNVVKARANENEVAYVDCFFRYRNGGGHVSSGEYNQFKFKVEVIGDLQLTDGAFTDNGQERTDITQAFQIRFKGRGGAIIVSASRKSNDYTNNGWSTYFVITAPYIGNKTWDFYSNPNTEMTYYHVNNTYPYWQETTKFNGHPERPLMVVDTDYDTDQHNYYNDGHDNIDGTNARYLPATAGLIFTCPDEGFGVNDNTKINPANNEPYRPNKYVVLGKNGSKFTIPHLEGGTYIRIWWDPINAGEHGGHYKAENVLDLDGNYISNTFTFSGVTDYDKCQGNTIFKVAGNKGEYKDVTFTLNDDGWTDIYKIQVMDTYETDMILADGTAGWNDMHTVLYNNDFGTIVHDGTGAQRLYSGHSGKSHIQRARTLNWEVSSEGDVTYTTRVDTWTHDRASYNDLILNITGGTGNIRIIQRVDFDGYTLDKNETWLAVGTYTQQSYPYTWDFTDYNVGRGTLNGALTRSPEHQYGYWDLIDATNQRFGLETHDLVDASKVNNSYEWNNVQIEKPLFAQGSQLVYGKPVGGVGVIKETEGLRVKQRSSSGLGVGEEFDKELSIDGNYLKFTPAPKSDHGLIITIPNIPQGEGENMWVFVKATAVPNSVYAATNKSVASELDPSTPAQCSLPDDVWAYQVTSAGDVEIYYQKNVEIQAIGVTNIFKSINLLGYATESRDVTIDHSYEGFFTNDDVNAYCILTDKNGSPYDYKGTPIVVKSEESVNVVPENTGIVLYKSGHDKDKGGFNVPLFYPACNVKVQESEQDLYDVNMMAPNVASTDHTSVTETWHGVECTKFVMSRQYYVYHKSSDGTGSNSGELTSEQEAFYRMRLNSGVQGTSNTMGANKAYLLIPTSKLPLALWEGGNGAGTPGYAKPGVIFMDDIEALFGGEEPISGIATAIDTIESTETVGNGNTYHTLSGMQIQGVPTQKGVYIMNGKKVLVK